MLSGRPTVSLVIHRSQLLWRVSSLDSWFLDKAHDSAAPCRRTDKNAKKKNCYIKGQRACLQPVSGEKQTRPQYIAFLKRKCKTLKLKLHFASTSTPADPPRCPCNACGVRCGCLMGLGCPEMECANISCMTMTGCMSQQSDSVPPREVSRAGLACGGQQLSGGGAVWVTVEAQAYWKVTWLCPLCLCEDP